MNNNTSEKEYQRGLYYALACYAAWGLFPLFWHLLDNVSPLVILANRIIWSAFFILIYCMLYVREDFLKLIRSTRSILYMGCAGILVTINWGTFIYAVNNGYVLETSLGYYINPLLNVLLGVLLLKEKLNLLEKLATGFAIIGVGYFTINYGVFPWISVILAVSMGMYGIVKKKANLSVIPALGLETLLIAPLAFLYLGYLAYQGDYNPFAFSTSTSLLLVVGGIITVIPLVLFASAVRSLPYSTLGFMQYLAPTLQLLLGVFFFHEKFTTTHAVCFFFIWLGLFCFTLSLVQKARKKKS